MSDSRSRGTTGMGRRPSAAPSGQAEGHGFAEGPRPQRVVRRFVGGQAPPTSAGFPMAWGTVPFLSVGDCRRDAANGQAARDSLAGACPPLRPRRSPTGLPGNRGRHASGCRAPGEGLPRGKPAEVGAARIEAIRPPPTNRRWTTVQRLEEKEAAAVACRPGPPKPPLRRRVAGVRGTRKERERNEGRPPHPAYAARAGSEQPPRGSRVPPGGVSFSRPAPARERPPAGTGTGRGRGRGRVAPLPSVLASFHHIGYNAPVAALNAPEALRAVFGAERRPAVFLVALGGILNAKGRRPMSGGNFITGFSGGLGPLSLGTLAGTGRSVGAVGRAAAGRICTSAARPAAARASSSNTWSART